MEKGTSEGKVEINSSTAKNLDKKNLDFQDEDDQGETFLDAESVDVNKSSPGSDNGSNWGSLTDGSSKDFEHRDQKEDSDGHVEIDELSKEINENMDLRKNTEGDGLGEGTTNGDSGDELTKVHGEKIDHNGSIDNKDEIGDLKSKDQQQKDQATDEVRCEEKDTEPVFDGTEVPGMEACRSKSGCSSDIGTHTEESAWPEKATTLKNFVKEKGAVAVSSVIRRLSGKGEEIEQDISVNKDKAAQDPSNVSGDSEVARKSTERSSWNPLSYVMMSREDNSEDKGDARQEPPPFLVLKGRIMLYTRLGCQDCRQARLFLQRKRLRYVEINIDVFPSRQAELEKFSGSNTVPKIFFNEVVIGGINELKDLDESGKFDDKIDYLIHETPSFEAPLPPLSGEDDPSSSGAIDELALIARKMRESIVIKDRFYRMRRFTNCFLGSEAVDFLSEDQYLEREEAVEFGRKLASKLLFRHVLEENLFEDGAHLYRFLDHDPLVSSQCYNIPRGIIDAKPKPILEIASRLRFLTEAIFEAYTSDDGKHVDYVSIHGSEEFARYLRNVEELQRIELQDMRREDKLAFFINLYNMMGIHAILVLGHPAGPLERRKIFGDFKYVIGGCTYSLSAIQNGILRSNQRPPYNLTKPFGTKDERQKVALPYPEPLIHFALVCGTRSGPALRCYSPGNIDKELMEAARSFLRGGGLIVDPEAKIASVSKILKWYSADFGNNEAEVLKHASNFLEPAVSESFLELLASNQLKVIYQPYDWGLNN